MSRSARRGGRPAWPVRMALAVLAAVGAAVTAPGQSQPTTQPQTQHAPPPQTQAGVQGDAQCTTQVAAQPQTRPATQPETQPATQPETQAATQPETQPAVRKPLTPEATHGKHRVDFDGSYASGMQWLDDGRHFLHRRDGRLMRVDALSDQAEPAYDQDALEAALRACGDFDERAARRCAERPMLWTNDRSAVLIEHNGHLYFYRFAERRLRKLTRSAISDRASPGAPSRRIVHLSANGAAVSFVRDNDLYVIDTRNGKQRRLTRDGSGTRLNGILDWVYQEEIYGRGRWRANWWRDDAEYLAYLQLDESRVPLYTLLDYLPHASQTEQTHYPKAGDPNPAVRLGIARRKTGRTVWVDLSRYDGAQILIVRVAWAPDGRLLFSVQDREQRWLDLNDADPRTGRMRTLIHEAAPAWLEPIAHPHWLPDGSFLWLSERDGWRHIYHYSRDGTLLRRITAGDWSVRSLHGCDPRSGFVYFSATGTDAATPTAAKTAGQQPPATTAQATPDDRTSAAGQPAMCNLPFAVPSSDVFETHACRVPLGGGPVERLTEPGYSHSASFDPTFTYFFDTFSNVATPTQVHLRRADGTLVRVVSENKPPALDEWLWTPPQLLRIPNRDGLPINLRIIRPPDFDPQRKYPVWCGVYGAPGAQSVRNHWGGSGMLLDQYLAQQGYLIVDCDPYQASGAGAVSAWHAYRRLGQTELSDLEDAVRWLIEHENADPERIGISGYSYGGFFVAYALTHSKMFKLGIAGAPVTDWRNYDSIYTERYMQTPEHNPDGYTAASVVAAAGNLHGRLLLVHGLRDDNVHFQNTAQLIDALQQAGKMFDLMIYPQDRHGIDHGSEHFRELQLQVLFEQL